jgi:hypothetical protein
VLLALDGRVAAARIQWDRSVANYPGDRAGIINVLDDLSSGDARIAGLLAYAKAQRIGETK